MSNTKYTEDDLREDLAAPREYEFGWSTDMEYEDFPIGLNEDIVRAISAKKEEPEWMTEWRLAAYREWLKMEEPEWPMSITKNPIFRLFVIMPLQRLKKNWRV